MDAERQQSRADQFEERLIGLAVRIVKLLYYTP